MAVVDLVAEGAGGVGRAEWVGQVDAGDGVGRFPPARFGRDGSRGRRRVPAAPRRGTQQVGLLEQRPYVFDTTVGENLLLAGPTASPPTLDRGVRTGGSRRVAGRGFPAASIPRWVNTVDTCRAVSGSASGWRGCCCPQHPVIVLDEPDEHLDALSADALMADLLEASAGRTTVVISHRLAPLAGVDQIVVLDGGRVIEAGTHGALVARGGWYARTWMREQEIAAGGRLPQGRA